MLSVLERHAEQRPPVEIEQIECLVHESRRAAPDTEPLLEQR